MNLTLLKGYPDRIGKRFAWVGFGTGPATYPAGGDPIALPGFQNYIDSIEGGVMSVSGNFFVRPVPSFTGARPTWKLRWFITATGLEVAANATTIAAETVQLGGFGGVY